MAQGTLYTAARPSPGAVRYRIKTEADLIAADDAIDRAVCGRSLACREKTLLAEQGAHDPTPTPYFVLQELFGRLEFDDRSHLLDVGCSTGRVLAHFLREGYPGQATGVELDPELAAVAQAWTSAHARLHVVEGSALDLDLSPFTHIYLFNPFDSNVLRDFISSIEERVGHPCTVVHMSDNGDTWWYLGRPGWTEVASDSFQYYVDERGYPVTIYENPQHFTIWRYTP